MAIRRTKAEDLADFVRRIRNEKRLSLKDVEIASGDGISKGYVGHIENRHVLPEAITVQKLRALAKGLSESEEVVFAIARGKEKRTLEGLEDVQVMFYGFDELSEEDKAKTLDEVRMIAEFMQRRRPSKPNRPAHK